MVPFKVTVHLIKSPVAIPCAMESKRKEEGGEHYETS